MIDAMTEAILHSRSDRDIVRGFLSESSAQRIVLSIPGTEYQLHLSVHQRPATPKGKRIAGVIRAQARRIDVVHRGGRFIEPVNGRPRRVQGEVVSIDPGAQTVTVHAGIPIVCKVDQPQRAEQFQMGDFVSFDVHSGASFTPSL